MNEWETICISAVTLNTCLGRWSDNSYIARAESLKFHTVGAYWRREKFESEEVFTLATMTSERLHKKEVQVKEEGNPVLDMMKEGTSSGTSIRDSLTSYRWSRVAHLRGSWPRYTRREEISFRHDKKNEVGHVVTWGLTASSLLTGNMLYHCKFQDVKSVLLPWKWDFLY